MKLSKLFIHLSCLGGVIAVMMRSQDIPQWNIVGALSFMVFVFAVIAWYSMDIDRVVTQRDSMNPFIILIKGILIFTGVLGFIFTFTTKDTFFCTPWNGFRIALIVIGVITELFVSLAYVSTFTSACKGEYEEIAV